MSSVSLQELLGLQDKPKNGLAWHECIVRGLSLAHAEHLLKHLESGGGDCSDLLTLTLEQDASSTLSVYVSDYLYRVARAARELQTVNGGNLPQAAAWLSSGQPSLKGRVPLELLRSQIGTDFVMTAISRIEPVKKESKLPQDIPPPEVERAAEEEEEDI